MRHRISLKATFKEIVPHLLFLPWPEPVEGRKVRRAVLKKCVVQSEICAERQSEIVFELLPETFELLSEIA